MLIRDLMTKRVITLDADAKLIDAVSLMVNHGFRHVPIIRDNTVVGLITALSIIKDVDKMGIQVLSGYVRDASLIANFIKASQSDDVNDIVKKMINERMDAALVFDGDTVIGIITERDLVHKIPAQLFSRRRIFDVMSGKPVVLDLDSSINDSIKTAATHDIRHLLIARGDRVMGVVSIRDILRHLMKHVEVGKGIDLGLSISSIMSHNPITIDPGAYVIDAVNLMRNNNVSSLPVVERGKLMGIVTERDLIREIIT
ncbi:MAG: CBS domain-containing protein [Vulcanisaeta sp. AZ3]|jgi:predicted transcriptional regulator